MPLGEGDLDILTNNAILLDALSFRAPEVASSSAAEDTGTVNHYSPNIATEVIWRGAFMMQSGMTDLDIEGWAQMGASENFQLFINGVGISTTAVPNGAAFAINADITGLTVDGVYTVVLQRSGVLTGPQALAAKYVIYDAYVSPAPAIGTVYPGKPVFSGVYSATLLNQLGTAMGYVAARLNAIPLIPFLAYYYAHGDSRTGSTYALWWGAVERANGSNIMNVRIKPMIIANASEYYRVKVNGSVVHTGAAMTAGEARDDYLSIDLSGFSASTRLEAVIETVITTGSSGSGDKNSRYHLWRIGMSNSAPAVAAAPTGFTAGELISATTVDSRLNALATMVDNAKTRITSNPRIFDRVRLMRHIYGRNEEQRQTFRQANTYTSRFARNGARLLVHGKGLRVGWGAITTKADKTTTTAYQVDFAHSEPLTDGDAYQTKTIYLDSLPYLRRGQAYTVYGSDLVLAQESLL